MTQKVSVIPCHQQMRKRRPCLDLVIEEEPDISEEYQVGGQANVGSIQRIP